MNSFARTHRSVLTMLLSIGAACFSPLYLSASTAQVFPAGGTACVAGVATTFNSISVAVGGVVSNSTIYVCPGTYAEQVAITKKLTLIGVSGNGLSGSGAMGANNPVIVSPAGGVVANAADLYNSQPTAAQIFVQTPSGSLATPILVKISNITVDGSNNGLSGCGTDLVGIYYQNASGIVDHVTTRYQELDASDFGCQDGLAIYIQSGYSTSGTANVSIENSSVHDYDKNGITADGSGTVATISGNYVVGIGATSLIAQNGVQMSDGARGVIKNNTVTDDVYVNPLDCGPPDNTPYCYSSTGILLYDSGGTSGSHVTISGNTVSNTQGAIVVVTDGVETADYNDVSSNKVTTNAAIVVPAITYLLDGIDLCSDHNTATSNTVFNSSGSGIHIDSECTEPSSAPTGNHSTVTGNTINEACAGVLTGSGTLNNVSGNITSNVVETSASGDTCPVSMGPMMSGMSSVRTAAKVKPQPRGH